RSRVAKSCSEPEANLHVEANLYIKDGVWLQNGPIRKESPEANLLKLECLPSLQIQTVNAKFFIYNLSSDFQAGRHRFDPRLPVFYFQWLSSIPTLSAYPFCFLIKLQVKPRIHRWTLTRTTLAILFAAPRRRPRVARRGSIFQPAAFENGKDVF